MSSLFFWFVYFTLNEVYKVKAVFKKREEKGRQDKTLSPGVKSLFVDLVEGGQYLTNDQEKGSNKLSLGFE